MGVVGPVIAAPRGCHLSTLFSSQRFLVLFTVSVLFVKLLIKFAL